MSRQLDQRDLLDRLDKWHQEVIEFAQASTQHVQTLEDAVKLIKAQEKSWQERNKLLLTILGVVLVISSTIAMAKWANLCTISLNLSEGISIESCKK